MTNLLAAEATTTSTLPVFDLTTPTTVDELNSMIDHRFYATDEFEGDDTGRFREIGRLMEGLKGWGLRKVVRGLVHHAAAVIHDELNMDIATIRDGGDPIDETAAVWMLPPMFKDRYDAEFTARFTAEFKKVSDRFITGWVPVENVAQELAVHMIAVQAAASDEIYDVNLKGFEEGDLYEIMLQDIDFMFLWEPKMMAKITNPEFAYLGVAPMDFDSWFTPFTVK